MSRRIDLTKPLSDEDKAYLSMLGREGDIVRNEQYLAEVAAVENKRLAAEKAAAEKPATPPSE